jgi:PhnB protein
MQLNPYLSFNGQCEAAFNFYAKVLGGKIDGILHNGDSPMRDNVPKDRHNLVMHAQISIGTNVIMGADMSLECGAVGGAGSIALTLNYDTPEEAERVFDALADGGTVKMPLAPTFWAQRFGAITDKFGTPWLINGGLIHPQ